MRILATVFCIITLLACTNNPKSAILEDKTPKEKKEEKLEKHPRLNLAQWSLHKALKNGSLDHLDFAQKASNLGFSGVEYVNSFFKDKAKDLPYLDKMNQAAKAAAVNQELIMVDDEGDLSSSNINQRNDAVDKHKKWIDAAKYLGCHSIRVNLFGEQSNEEKWISNSVDALTKLCSYAQKKSISVLVENHGYFSSKSNALAKVMFEVGLPNCGTLPDFGNFCLKRLDGKRWGAACQLEYDRYKGVSEMLPYAQAMSAKSYHFNDKGIETKIDYRHMAAMIRSSGYTGKIGVEYEGDVMSEEEGILATRALLIKYFEL